MKMMKLASCPGGHHEGRSGSRQSQRVKRREACGIQGRGDPLPTDVKATAFRGAGLRTRSHGEGVFDGRQGRTRGTRNSIAEEGDRLPWRTWTSREQNASQSGNRGAQSCVLCRPTPDSHEVARRHVRTEAVTLSTMGRLRGQGGPGRDSSPQVEAAWNPKVPLPLPLPLGEPARGLAVLVTMERKSVQNTPAEERRSKRGAAISGLRAPAGLEEEPRAQPLVPRGP